MIAEHSHILEKARQFCDYQERCIQDVKDKLKSWQITHELTDAIILSLEKENYIDEDRFVRAYALGKLRHNKWGRNKILYALKQKNIPDLVIQIGLQEIDTDEYLEVLKQLLQSKTVKAANAYEAKAKMAQYAIQKGFQPSLVWELLNAKDA